MVDFATPNLPSRDFEVTARFYEKLGFAESRRTADWMIFGRGDLVLEFFLFPDLDPVNSSFSAAFEWAM